MTNTEELAYLAGIFDGEGCVTAIYDKRVKKYRLRICIVNTNLNGILFCQSILNKNNILHGKHSRLCKSGKVCYSILVSNLESINKFIEIIIPYSVIKIEQLEAANSMIKETDTFQNNLTKLRNLNLYRGRKRPNKDQEFSGKNLVGLAIAVKQKRF